MTIKPARRTEHVQEYYFSRKNRQLDAMNAERLAQGKDKIISLGIGAPDRMPPQPAIDKLCEVAKEPGSHVYQNYTGLPALREAFASWYSKYYGVTLNPVGEIQPLVGSKEGILLISLAFVNPGEKVLVPDPGYPTYITSARLADAEVVTYDLKEENGFLPDFDELEKMDLDGVKLMWTNYPNMPTGASATPELYQRIVDFGRKHNILVVNDNPYSFILNSHPCSILAAEGARECALELNSLSKAHNMSGWRIGMVAGASEMVAQVLKVKSQMDSGMFKAMQMAGVEAIAQGDDWFTWLNDEYELRQKEAAKIFDLLDVKYPTKSSGLFLWGKVRPDHPLIADLPDDGRTVGEKMSDALLYGAGVFMTPGIVFGKNGKDYVRVSLCATVPVLQKAYGKIKDIL